VSQGNRAIAQALLVTFLWSSSWVLIKQGLVTLPALTFAGLRYTIAFLCLLAALLVFQRQQIAKLNLRQVGILALLGLVYYFLTQGALFLSLVYLPANTLSLVLTLSGITIALAGWLFLGERLTWLQWSGVAISIAGAILYFGSIQEVSVIGLWVAAFALLSNTASAVLGRSVNKSAGISPLVVTTVSMGVGAVCLLLVGLAVEPLPAINTNDVVIIVWLALANTAFAFTLWNHTLRTLTAAQSSVINNTMLIQIAILAWVFLGESLGTAQILGLTIAALGTIVVQVTPRRILEGQAISE
jgi:drug/metabolite transporter (DMT)-like permease